MEKTKATKELRPTNETKSSTQNTKHAFLKPSDLKQEKNKDQVYPVTCNSLSQPNSLYRISIKKSI